MESWEEEVMEKFSRWVFLVAGTVGLLMLFPMYFLEGQISADQPPAITHPEFFYGFVGIGVAWQVAFLVIGSDPVRHRPLMLPSIIEKFRFAGAVTVLFFLGRVAAQLFFVSLFDLTLGVLFTVAYFSLGSKVGKWVIGEP